MTQDTEDALARDGWVPLTEWAPDMLAAYDTRHAMALERPDLDILVQDRAGSPWPRRDYRLIGRPRKETP